MQYPNVCCEPLAIMKFENSNFEVLDIVRKSELYKQRLLEDFRHVLFGRSLIVTHKMFSVKDFLINVLLHHRSIQLIPLMTSDSNNGGRVWNIESNFGPY